MLSKLKIIAATSVGVIFTIGAISWLYLQTPWAIVGVILLLVLITARDIYSPPICPKCENNGATRRDGRHWGVCKRPGHGQFRIGGGANAL